MSKIKIVLISGKMGSGKSTLAKTLETILTRLPSICVVQLAYADALYEMHDFCLTKLRDAGIEGLQPKYGELLQDIGTWGRKIDPDVWVKLLRQKMVKHAEMKNWAKQMVFIISDVRFKNEFDAFPEALSVRLVADRETRKMRCHSWRDRENHPSEVDLDDYSFQKKFKMYFETSKPENTPEHMAELIAHEILCL